MLDPDAINNLGNMCRDEGRSQDAETLYTNDLERFSSKNDRDSVVAQYDLLNNLGLIYLEHRKLEAAEEALGRSFAGKREAWGESSSVTLNTLHNLGMLFDE